MTNTNYFFGQRAISDIEKYIFDSFFQPVETNKITQIIEEDETSQITRKWVFNEKGQLSKECDWRESGFSSSLGFSSTTNYKEYIYQYNSEGKIKQIIETQVQDGDTSETIHKFDYSIKNEIKESFRVKKNDLIDIEFIIVTNFKNGLPNSITNLSISHIGEGYVESKTREVYQYDEKKVLSNKANYFSINSYPKNEDNEPKSEMLSVTSEYDYDELGRIIKILEHEFDEKEEDKLHRKIQFQYNEDNLKIANVNMLLGESYRPRELQYEITYKNNGRIKQIKVNDKTYFYKIEEKK